MTKNENERVNEKIAEAVIALNALKRWYNDPAQDKKAKGNTQYWLQRLLTFVLAISASLNEN